MWPKRMDINHFLKEGFVEGSQPHVDTLKRRIERGDIPGEVQGSRYYVWVGPNLELMAPQTSTGDTLADAIMNQWLEEQPHDEEAA